MVSTHILRIITKGFTDVIDITDTVERAIQDSGLTDGTVTVFIPGSTAGVTTLEYESGAVQDLKDLMDRWIPPDIPYKHNARWEDENGFSHVRAACIGPSLTVPFKNEHLLLGTWQQIIIIDFDARPRHREVVLQIMGEKMGTDAEAAHKPSSVPQ
jgi:secondary thiamine-phosphate synthase enzyme